MHEDYHPDEMPEPGEPVSSTSDDKPDGDDRVVELGELDGG